MQLPAKYLAKNVLHGLTPGGFGHYRKFRQHLEPEYDHQRDKHPVREHHNQQAGWNSTNTPLYSRRYQSYQEYTLHQAQKFTEILRSRGGFPNHTVVTWRRRFYQRFKHLLPLLSPDAVILCLGARQGTEVEVLRDLGFHRAYGIDLNPGPNNPFVKPGDFMHLSEPDSSVDCVFTNSIDHAFDLAAFIQEQVRVLKATGYALYDLPRYSGTRQPGAFEAIGWDSEEAVIAELRKNFPHTLLQKTESKWQWLLLQKSSVR